MAKSYDLELKITGQSATLYSGISASGHVVTGLAASTGYEFRVRQVDTGSHGGSMFSMWSSWATFTTQAAAAPIFFSFNTSTQTATASTLSMSIAQPPQEIQADQWDIEIRNKITLAVTSVNNLTAKTHNATGLTAGTNYDFRVKGKANNGTVESQWSDWFEFVTDLATVYASTSGTLSNANLDLFHVGVTDFSLIGGYVNITGTATHNAHVEFEIEGVTFVRDVLAPTWSFTALVDPTPQIRYLERLDEFLDDDDPLYFLIEGPSQTTGNDTLLI